MGHHHHHHKSNNIKVAFFLNLGFTIIEIIGGIFTNSVAILSDALHDLGDSLSLGLAWYFQNLSNKAPNKKFSFGYQRFSLLGALINSIVLILGSILIFMEAIPRLINPETPNVKGMFLLAILGILVNGAAVLKLKKGKSLNEKVVSLHLLEDVLGWVAVMVGSIVMYFFDIPIIDPILSVLIALYILFNVFKNSKSCIKIMMQAVPENLDLENLKQQILALAEIKKIESLRAWSLDGMSHVMTLKIVVEKNIEAVKMKALKTNIQEMVKEKGVDELTIEFVN